MDLVTLPRPSSPCDHLRGEVRSSAYCADCLVASWPCWLRIAPMRSAMPWRGSVTTQVDNKDCISSPARFISEREPKPVFFAPRGPIHVGRLGFTTARCGDLGHRAWSAHRS